MVCWGKLILHLRYHCDCFLVREVTVFSTLNVFLSGEKWKKLLHFIYDEKGEGENKKPWDVEQVMNPSWSFLPHHHSRSLISQQRSEGCKKEVVGGTYLRARWSWKPNRSFVTDFTLQKSEKRGEKWAGSWLPGFLFRTAHPCQAVFPAGHGTFRKGDWEAEDAWLLTRGPAFPRAPGTPGKPWLPWERHIFLEHNEASKKSQFPRLQLCWRMRNIS